MPRGGHHRLRLMVAELRPYSPTSPVENRQLHHPPACPAALSQVLRSSATAYLTATLPVAYLRCAVVLGADRVDWYDGFTRRAE